MDVKQQVTESLGKHVKGFQGIPSDIWDRLLEERWFTDTLKLAATKPVFVQRLAFGVYCAMAVKERVFYHKPTARERHKQMLDFVWEQAIGQYIDANGLSYRDAKGKLRNKQGFDHVWHLARLFTPDVDFSAIYKRWNELSPSMSALSEAAFRKTCQRAWEELDESYFKTLLSGVICPDAKARASSRASSRREEEREAFLCDIERLRLGLKMVERSESDWPAIAAAYNEYKGTNHSAQYLQRKYYRLKHEANKREGQLSPSFERLMETVARRSVNEKDFLSQVRRCIEALKKKGFQEEIIRRVKEEAAQGDSQAAQ